MTYSVRERILQQGKKNLEALQDQNSSLLFESVYREPIDSTQFSGSKACALIDEGEQVAVYEIGFLEIDMVVSIEFWIRMEIGSDQSTELNEVAALVTKLYLSDLSTIETGTGAALSLNVRMGSLQFDIDGPTDEYVRGMRQFHITYRHSHADPYDLR